MWTGVAIAVASCLSVGVSLHLLDRHLPQQQQEQLEAVIARVAAVAVTYMVVWMRRHARDLRGVDSGGFVGETCLPTLPEPHHYTS